MVDDTLSNKKLNPIVKTKHFSCFYDTILFYCIKKILRPYVIMKIPNKWEL